MKLIKKEYFEDQEGKKVRHIFKGGRSSVSLLEPSQWYIDNIITPTQPEKEKHREIIAKGKAISLRVRQLGYSRSADPVKIATEDVVFKDTTDAMTTDELEQVVSKLQWLGGKTFQQIDNYIDNNVTNMQSAKAFLKIITKVILATLKLVLILVRRELPPEEE